MKKKRVKVNYKGDTFILQPGHAVYELNTDTGIVKEHKIKKSFWSKVMFWTDPVYNVQYAANIVHRPFFNIDKAITEYTHMFREYKKECEKEGRKFVVRKAS